jgi:starch synthase
VYIPQWDSWKRGLLEWKGSINPLASGIKCSWKVTTVSNSYLHELRQISNGLEPLFEYERGKCTGILNGIDYSVWDPAHDKYLTEYFSIPDAEAGKERNKRILCDKFGLDPQKPLFIFIGRLVGEKGADLLPQAIADSFTFIGRKMNFLVLGNGEAETEVQLTQLKSSAKGDYNVFIGYNETLSHLMYAGADFLVMPSRVEPCGLNQLYAMRYGTIPVVRSTGGLKDTVIDIGEPGGYGITFNDAAVGDITHGIYRSVSLYRQKEVFRSIREKIMALDFSWHRSAEEYVSLYQSFQ